MAVLKPTDCIPTDVEWLALPPKAASAIRHLQGVHRFVSRQAIEQHTRALDRPRDWQCAILVSASVANGVKVNVQVFKRAPLTRRSAEPKASLTAHQSSRSKLCMIEAVHLH